MCAVHCAVQGIHKAVGLTAMILDCIPKINNVYYNIYNNIGIDSYIILINID